MKKFVCISYLFVAFLIKANATIPVSAYLTFATFNAPGKTPYIETYLTVIGNSVTMVAGSQGKFIGSVDIAVSFTQNDLIKNAQKYTLNSPEIADTTNGLPNFIDQQRYSLPNGTYTLEITIADKNKPGGKTFETKLPVVIDFTEGNTSISDIQLLESYSKATTPGILTKSGYDLIPYVSNFYPENINKIKFYAEVYNAKKMAGDGEKVLLSYFLEAYESKMTLNDYSAFSKQIAGSVNILLSELNITSLPSGNYNLVIELHDKENKLLAGRKCFFQRKNKQAEFSINDLKAIDVSKTFVQKYKNVDTLYEYIRCLRPICSSAEVQYCENQLKGRKLEDMQQFFYNFWYSRHNSDTELAWLEYYNEVKKVNKEFGAFGSKGYDTDRGRVYLQYGSPSFRNKIDQEEQGYPYEIWEYASLVDKTQELSNPNNSQSNRKFIFYDPSFVSSRYILIHSTAKGEVINNQWEYLIKGQTGTKQSKSLDDPDKTEQPDNFRNPR